jgi:hypothetical protein
MLSESNVIPFDPDFYERKDLGETVMGMIYELETADTVSTSLFVQTKHHGDFIITISTADEEKEYLNEP